MKVRRNVWLRRGWGACLFGALLAVQALAAPGADLEKAVSLFNEGHYQQAQEVLLGIDRDALNDDQKRQRDELVEAARLAINQSSKAGQDLDDARKAIADGNRASAEKMFKAVLANDYASADQIQAAREGLALLAKQKELNEKVAANRPSAPVVATQPAGRSATPATAPAATPSPDAREQARLIRNRALAAEAIRKGDNALKAGQYDEALAQYQEALQLVPNHPEALKGLELVRQHRQVEGQGDLLDEAVAREKGRWMRTETLYAENERQIRKLISESQYPQAREKLEVTRRLLEASKRDAQPEDRYGFLVRQIDALDRFIASEESDYERDQIMRQREAARQQERDRREAVQKEKDERIGQLMDQVMQLQKEHNYRQAAEVLREVLVIDPTYRNAEFQLRLIEDSEVIRGQKKTHEQFLNHAQQAFVGASGARTPETVGVDNRYVVYPDESEWRMILNRDPFGAGLSGETDADRATREKLATVLPEIEFEAGTGFEDVILFLREQGKLSIDVNWNALAAVNIDKMFDTGGLSLQNVKIETALQILLSNVGGADVTLGFDVIDGVVRVSTLEDLNSKTLTRVYDVRDLLIKIRSFRSESEGGMGMMGMMGGMGMGGMMGGMGGGMMGGMGGGMMGGMGGMGGGYGGGMGGGMGGGYGGGGGGDEDEAEEEREELVEDLQELIKNQIEPGTWQPDGEPGSMDIWNDRMIVTHTAIAHRRLVELLKQLRESKDIQVMVEAKFVTLRTNFLEEIGVDLDMVLNAGQAGYDQALSGGAPVVDPRTGQLLVQPRRFTQLGYAPAAAPLGGVPLVSTSPLEQPFGNVALVPQGSPNSWWDRHTTPIPVQNNALALAGPRGTGVPGSLADTVRQAGPAFQVFGSFLDNIQVDFLLRATQMDSRGSSVDAPRLVCYNGREGFVEVNTYVSYVATPGFGPVGGSGVGGQAARGSIPGIGSLPRGRTFSVLPTVSGDRRYVTMEVKPMVTNATLRTIPINATSNALAAFFQTPDFEITQIRTTVSVPDEGTLLLGGLRLSAEEEVEAGVPVISKIPVLKRAYTNRSKTRDDFVLLVLVKPTIIIPEEQEEHAFEGLMSADKTGG